VGLLEGQNVLDGVGWTKQPLAKYFATDARTGAIDQAPQARSSFLRRWHNLEILKRRPV
jgi:hypothetical protein